MCVVNLKSVNKLDLTWKQSFLIVLYAALMCLQFGFLIFWRKDFGAKAAHKMLVKLTPGGRKWQHDSQNSSTTSNISSIDL
jgi:hypothetical protein